MRVFFKCPNYEILNECVHFEQNWIYVAVPKTGSTTVRLQIPNDGKSYLPNPHLSLHQIKNLIYPYLLKCNLGTNGNVPTREEHPTDKQLYEFALEKFEKMFKFGSVRNPWARTYSLYTRKESMRTIHQRDEKEKISFSEFVERIKFASDTCIHPLKMESQLEWFTDHDGNVLADYIYKLEEFDNAIDIIREETNGLINLKSFTRNKVNEPYKYRDVYSDKDKKIIAKLFEKDIDFFKYSF